MSRLRHAVWVCSPPGCEIPRKASPASLPSRLMAISPSERMPTQALITIEDWQASNLNVGHIARDFLDLLIVETVFDVLGHDVTHLGFRPFPLGDTADRDIAIGDHTDQVIILADGKHPGIETRHGLGGLPNCFLWTSDANVPRHGFTYFHRYLLSLSSSQPWWFRQHLTILGGALGSELLYLPLLSGRRSP